MGLSLGFSLVGLAFLDSTSIGTLFIPLWLLMAPGPVQARRILLYLATIALFYFAIGLLIVLGTGAVPPSTFDTRQALWVQFAAGLGLLAFSFRLGRKERATNQVKRWRERITKQVVGLALLAGLVEVATMLPYLAAIGIMTTSDISLGQVVALLAGYCVVMVLPALALLSTREAAKKQIERLSGWITTKAPSATGWALGIVGFLVARDALARLLLPDLLG
jgi:cytochrome c biogenesis protein CcdA